MIQPGMGGEVTLNFEPLATMLTRVSIMLSMFTDEMRPQALFAGEHQAANDAGKLALITGESVIVCDSVVFLGKMRDHRGSLIAAKIARYAWKRCLLLRHLISECRIFFHVRFTSAHNLRRVREFMTFQ